MFNLYLTIPPISQFNYKIMTLIGITGHRALTDKNKITEGIKLAFERIRVSFAPPFVAVSPLAEGSDCLFARQAIEYLGASLVVCLPLPLNEYIEDFSGALAREEFKTLMKAAGQVIQLPACETREQAYLAAGYYVVEHCEVLLAVWDGESARGVGGTGQIVQLARKRGLPLAWIHSGKRADSLESGSEHDKKLGRIAFERFPDAK
ncbi:MAG: hypothetical protein WCK35_06365 [Chloroflexota bacterium]